MRNLTGLLILLAITLPSNSQTFQNTLLWKIQRKGDSHASYLYGTMHLTDKRVFQLGDSVYKALEQTEAFAAELDMNRMGIQILNQIMADREEKKSREPELLKDLLDPATWQLYKEQLSKKLEKKAEKITVDDLDRVEKEYQRDVLKAGEMPTFLDAWLFGKARRQEKWVGGIEDFEDQMQIEDDLEDKIRMVLFEEKYFRNDVSRLMRIYQAQQLDSIDRIYYRDDAGKDFLLIKRNIKMARRIDSLMQLRSTLFAVGVAHLPGDSGLIKLLRQRGFDVSPVFSSKKISADKYVTRKDEEAWIPYIKNDSSYQLSMPGIAEGFKLIEDLGIDMKCVVDMPLMKMYFTMSVPMSESRKKLGADSIFNGLQAQYAKRASDIKQKRITVNGLEGAELSMKTEFGTLRMQVFLPWMEMIILNGACDLTEKATDNKDFDKFFSSFKVNEQKKPKPSDGGKEWSQVKSDELFFSIEMPGKPKFTKDARTSDNQTNFNYQYIDLSTQAFYNLAVFRTKAGSTYSGRSENLTGQLADGFRQQFGEIKVLDSSRSTIDGYPAYHITIGANIEGSDLEIAAIYLTRGNFIYYAFVVYETKEENRNSRDRFFRSFKLIPIARPPLRKVTSPDGSFTTMAPYEIKEDEKEESDLDHMSKFSFYDSSAAVTIVIEKYQLPEWLWWNSDTAFFRKMINPGYDETLKDFSVCGSKYSHCVNYSIGTSENSIKKGRMILNGNDLFVIHGSFDEADQAVYAPFYEEFTIRDQKAVPDRTRSRMKEFASFVEKAKVLELKEANTWWKYIDLSSADIPELQRLSLRLYPDFDSSYYLQSGAFGRYYSQNPINSWIQGALQELDTLHSSIAYYKEHFGSIEPKHELVKPFIYNYLSTIETIESYQLLKKLLLDYPVPSSELGSFYPRWHDSLQLSATLFPEFLRLLDTKSLWSEASDLAVELYDSSLLNIAVIRQYEKQIIRTTKTILAANKGKTEAGYQYHSLIRLLQLLNNAESNALLRQFGNYDNRDLKFAVLVSLLKNKQQVDSRTVLTLATTDEYRHDLYDTLKYLNRLSLFPSYYATQQQLARSKAFLFAYDDDEPQNVYFIKEKTIRFKDKESRFFLFRVTFSDEDAGYLVVIGPYDLNGKMLLSDQSGSGVYWEEEFDAGKIEEFFNKHFKSLQEGEKESAEKVKPPPPMISN